MIAKARARISATRAALPQHPDHRAFAAWLRADGTAARSAPRRAPLALAALCVTLTALLLLAAPALAARTASTSAFGNPTNPVGLAVDNSSSASSGDVYVSSLGTGQVLRLNAEGNRIGEISGVGGHLAVNSANGDLYASDLGGVVRAFTPEGAFLFNVETPPGPSPAFFGLAVDPSKGVGGTLYVGDLNNGLIDEFDATTGAFLSQFGAGHVTAGVIQSLAVDASGNVYAVNEGQNVVEFDSTGAFVQTIDTDSPTAVAVDPSSDHIFVAENDAGGMQIAEYASPGAAPIETFGQGEFPAGARVLGLGVNGETNTVYAADFANSVGHIFAGPVGPQQPLTVEVEGEGTLTSSPAGINCLPACAHEFNEGFTAVLTAHPATHNKFLAWEGCDSVNGEGKCEVEMTEPKSVKAIFAPIPQQTLEVEVEGLGEVTSSPAGISCPGTCSEHFDSEGPGSIVTLTATAGAQAVFKGWSGCESVSGPENDECTVTMSEPKLLSASFQPLPIATTGEATALAQTTATLNAQVNPNGTDTTCSFEYGATTGYTHFPFEEIFTYDHTVPCFPADLGSGETDQSATAQLSGLHPNTPYHFRVSATSSVGTSVGSDQTFTTQPPDPPTLTTGEATEVTQTTVTIAGTVNGHGVDTHYLVVGTLGAAPNPPQAGGDYGADAGVISTDIPVSIPVTGLTPNITYHYHIAAYNQVSCQFSGGFICASPDHSHCIPDNVFGGTQFCHPNLVDGGEDRTFTTLPLLPAVHTKVALGIGIAAATLTGSVNPQGAPTTYRFEYGLADCSLPASECAPVAEESAGSASAPQNFNLPLTGLTPDTIYHYRIAATNAGGTSYGEDETFATYGIAPAATTEAATDLGSQSATLHGSVGPQNSDTSYRFEYGTTANYGTISPEAGAGSDNAVHAVSAALAALRPATTYHFRIVATSGGGTTNGVDRTFTTQPAPPGGGGGGGGGGNPPPLTCRKGFVKKHGRCVKKPHHKKHHRRSHQRAAHSNRGGAK